MTVLATTLMPSLLLLRCTGIDMTPAQLEVAQRHSDAYSRDVLGYSQPNMRFVRGEIEFLDAAGIADESVDLVVSNCVVSVCCQLRCGTVSGSGVCMVSACRSMQ